MKKLTIDLLAAIAVLGFAAAAIFADNHEIPDAVGKAGYGKIDLSGLKELKEESLGGYLVLHLWATWCPHCMAEWPDFVKFFKETELSNTRVAAISFDRPFTMEKYEGTLQKHRPNFENYLGSFESLEELQNETDPEWGGGIPATFLFDERGKLVFSHAGALDFDVFDKELERHGVK